MQHCNCVSDFVFLHAQNPDSASQIRTFLAQIASGNLNASLGQEVLSRNDELSEIGISALSMQRSLRNLLEQDTLTGLSNRRFGDQKLSETHRRFTEMAHLMYSASAI